MATSAEDDAVRERLRLLADVAVRHAAEFHGATLADERASLALVERILAAERAHRPPAATVQTLATCYGAWLGGLLVRTLGGTWIALHESFPPRVRLREAVVSPIDAVRARLGATPGPDLGERYAQAAAWSAAAPARHALLAVNARQWDLRAQDPRFIADAVPPDAAGAHALLDPWLRAEGVDGRRVLCLAAAGGRHAPLLARAGAQVTVLDLSPAQLAIDERLARTCGLRIDLIAGSMDELGALVTAASFDVVVQPVSACYLQDLAPLHAGLAHALRPGGLLVAQHKQPGALQARAAMDGGGWLVGTRHLAGLALPPVAGSTHREDGTLEFLHPLEELVGGLCRAGFVIEDLAEPAFGDAWAAAGSSEQRAAFLPSYLKLKARRR